MLENTSFLTNTINKKSKYSFLSLFCITMLIAVVTLPSITIHKSSFVYAQTPLALKTLEVIGKLSNKLLERGHREILKVSVYDQQNHQPISGALVKAIVTYPGGKIIKQMAFITDIDGQVFFKIPTRVDDFFGTYTVDIQVSLTGYNDVSFATSFSTANVPSVPINNAANSVMGIHVSNVTADGQGVHISSLRTNNQNVHISSLSTNNQDVRINEVKSGNLGVPIF
jgi:hypothetical protein